jgi:DNA-binding MarR family transcriptional regulator
LLTRQANRYAGKVTAVRWLSRPEDRAWRGYRRMRTLLDLRLARDLAQHSGLSEPDYDVLSTLTERPDSQWRASELATHLLWSSSRLAHHVGRMERRGLVRRMPCEDDGRGALITLTDHGRTVLEHAAPGHVESVRRNFVDLLTTGEITTLAAIAEKVTTHLNPGD